MTEVRIKTNAVVKLMVKKKISHFMCAAWQLLRVLIVYYDSKDFLVFRDKC